MEINMISLFELLFLAIPIIGVFINNTNVAVCGIIGHIIFTVLDAKKFKATASGAYYLSFLELVIIFIINLFVQNMIILIINISAFIISLIAYINYRTKLIDSLPLKEEKAKVLSKHTEFSGQYTTTTFYITFELKNDIRKYFEVTNEVYSLLQEGDQGIIFFKESNNIKQFVKFIPHKKAFPENT